MKPTSSELDPVIDELVRAGFPQDELSIVIGLDTAERISEGVPTAEQFQRMHQAADEVLRVLGPVAKSQLASSPLGVGWDTDLDLHVERLPHAALLQDAGWVRLDSLLDALGSGAKNQWAVLRGSAVLARLDISMMSAPSPMTRLLERCRRMTAARIREVLEARALVRAGESLPSDDPATALLVARDAEFGGRLGDSVSRSARAPIGRHPGGVVADVFRRGLGRLRRRRVGLALSGTDGAGKSTLAHHLATDLQRLGVPVDVVWTRPGMRPGVLAALAPLAKRVLGQPSEPGIRAAGRGDATALASRRGTIGWTWTLLVTLSFLVDVWRRCAGRRTLVIFDRHVMDASVTLSIVYTGVDTRVQQWLCARLLPRASATVLVDVDAATARSRKSDDLFEIAVLADQVVRYRVAADQHGARVVDGRRAPDELSSLVLTHLCETLG